MPSWNIHAAQVERLIDGHSLAELGILDANTFLFGNLLPDVYVGYLVDEVGYTLNYCDIHLTVPHAIPIPGEREFWERYVAPAIEAGGADDLVLGTWAHLLTDNRYNEAVRRFNDAHGIPAGNLTRVRKQHDFDLFGHELAPRLRPEVTPGLLASCARFPQYAVDEADARAAVASARHLLDNPGSNLAPKDRVLLGPDADSREYLLLDEGMLRSVFDEVERAMGEGLGDYVARMRAAGHDPQSKAPEMVIERPELPIGPPPAVLLAGDWQAAAVDRPDGPGPAESGPEGQ